jgi:hypothetical protein
MLFQLRRSKMVVVLWNGIRRQRQLPDPVGKECGKMSNSNLGPCRLTTVCDLKRVADRAWELISQMHPNLYPDRISGYIALGLTL